MAGVAGHSGRMNLAEMNANLNRAKAGFDRWAHSRMTAVETVRQKHDTQVLQSTQEAADLEEREQSLSSQVKKMNTNLQKENKEAKHLFEELNKLKDSTKTLPPELERVRHELSLKEEHLNQELSDQQSSVKSRQHKLKTLQDAANMYSDRLGLRFQHSQGDTNALKIVFTQLDRREPERAFWFAVCVQDDNTYSVQQVVPEMKGVKQLEVELNRDNDFSKFVRNMRKRFQENV